MTTVNEKPIIFLNKYVAPTVWPKEKVPITQFKRKDTEEIVILPEGTKSIKVIRNNRKYDVEVEPLYEFEGEFIKPLEQD